MIKGFAKRIEEACPGSTYDPNMTLDKPCWFGCGTSGLDTGELSDGIREYTQQSINMPPLSFGLQMDTDYRTGVPFVHIFAVAQDK